MQDESNNITKVYSNALDACYTSRLSGCTAIKAVVNLADILRPTVVSNSAHFRNRFFK